MNFFITQQGATKKLWLYCRNGTEERLKHIHSCATQVICNLCCHIKLSHVVMPAHSMYKKTDADFHMSYKGELKCSRTYTVCTEKDGVQFAFIIYASRMSIL